ncbi:CBASS cGAMP synthase [Flavobacterium sp. CAN_S2]|uniref:CBASS cGAMP synthase n=1 Tax=Flavobacterium sp. CAN_S2 TaxID=2787726 RepID=UPI0018CB31F3
MKAMANCSKLFLDFNKVITPSTTEMQKMKSSREALEKKITAKLKDKLNQNVSYYTQGSGAKDMKTIIIKEDGTYDADRGVFLPEKPNVTGETVQKYIYDAVKDHTADGAENRKKCIRVFYKAAYNIDFPAYYEVKGEDYAYMAVKGDGWIKDDPWHMIKWLVSHKDSNGQLVRVIKYLKVWASKCNFKMPSGIAFAVWAANNFSEKLDRDDESLYETLKNIQSKLFWGVVCNSPVEPFDDLVSKLNQDQKNKFKKELDKFVDDAKEALDENNQLKSSKIWRKFLGERFPLGIDEDVDAKEKALLFSANRILSNSAYLDEAGKINTTNGVPHKPHRNYGD